MKTWHKQLVVLDVMPQDLTESQLQKVKHCNWYEVADELTGVRIITVPFRASGEVSETNPRDAGFILWGCPAQDASAITVTRIDDYLKRWNEVDGFYHA